MLSTTEGKSVGTTPLEIDHDDVASAAPTTTTTTTSATSTSTIGGQSTDTARLSAELIAIKSALHGVTVQLGNFQGHYMTTMESKILQLFTTMTSLDSNLKALQERAHVWDIFKHHIEAWSDHMKSVDKKIDLIKRWEPQVLKFPMELPNNYFSSLFRSQDTSFELETKLTALENKNNHIFERVDMVNEKMHDMLKILFNQKTRTCEPSSSSSSAADLKDSRLANIERQITMIQNNHCKSTAKRLLRQNPNETYSQGMTMITEPSKELKQLLALNKKTLNNVEYLSETVTSLNLTTNQMQRSLTTCCLNNERRVVNLRDSVDAAFQKLERIYLNLEVTLKTGQINNNTLTREVTKVRTIELEDPSNNNNNGRNDEDDEDGSGSGSGEEEIREPIKRTRNKTQTKTKPRPRTPKIRKETFRSNCHEIRGAEDGIYSFGFADDVNDQGRKFNHRYCRFINGNTPGWTVIQRRGNFGRSRENFNCSWTDYKNGFGDLDKEFWYGNDFIHQLTNEDGQVELRIEMEDFSGHKGVVYYNRFYVSSERSYYRLDVQGFDGNVSDSLLYHNQMYFSTYDSANDHSSDVPCALSHGSGWWWNNCLESNLNGRYSEEPLSTHYTGIIWEQWLGDYSLKSSQMMIRKVAPNGLWIDNDDDEDDRDVVDVPLSAPEDP